ncbi:unnamed protein product [Owenia fusiformis]|uniref:TGF-beta family profile domain-containing protein n=1 Tax=Owenia fusiformis TaxID=6347 RepID=A0A8S4PEQ4_OWEFU|nr:unnamed protein product [Owenia fusiformis]
MKVPVCSVFVIVCLIDCSCIMGAARGKAHNLKEPTPQQKSYLQRIYEAIWGHDLTYVPGKLNAFENGEVKEKATENGADERSEVINTYTRDEGLTAAQELELHMLNLLGLKEVPKPGPRSKVPIYMELMYNKLSSMGDHNPLSGVDIYAHSAIKGSNIEEGVLHFKLSRDIDPDTILSAELALYRYYANRCPDTISRMYRKIPKINVCAKNIECVTIKTPNMRQPWYDTFDISDIIKELALAGVTEFSIKIRIEGISATTSEKLARVFPKYSPNCIYKISPEQTGQQPLLVVYHEDPTLFDEEQDYKRSKRSHRFKKKLREINNLVKMHPEWGQNQIPFADECKLHSWEFDFSTLNWDWWIAPKRRTVNFCKGWCHRHPPTMNTHHISSNHAFLVNMYHTEREKVAQLKRGPEHTTCVPETYKPMLVLYVNGDGNAQTLYLDKLIVESCGCR